MPFSSHPIRVYKNNMTLLLTLITWLKWSKFARFLYSEIILFLLFSMLLSLEEGSYDKVTLKAWEVILRLLESRVFIWIIWNSSSWEIYLFSTYLLIQSFTLVWTNEYLLHSLACNPILHYLSCYLNCSSFGYWELFYWLLCLFNFFTFRYYKSSKVILYILYLQS